MDIFFEIHKDIPREGPGDNKSTAKALAYINNLAPGTTILDIGCGPGIQTLELARHHPGPIIALDNHQSYLEKLQEKIENSGNTNRIFPVNASMFDLPVPSKSIDCIWSEGAIYIIGFEKGLLEWKPFLKPGGCLAVTEISWLRTSPPTEVYSYWMSEYPGMQSVTDNLQIAYKAGYEVLGHFNIPVSSWWNEYYTPIEKRIPKLRDKYHGNDHANEVLDATLKEMDFHRRFSDWYGYVFYILKA
jgi:ubiquinone/menaquinone biosynthesis C-methylase UbiE